MPPISRGGVAFPVGLAIATVAVDVQRPTATNATASLATRTPTDRRSGMRREPSVL